jgi:hypothetical protein
VRDAAIETERENRDDRVRCVLEQGWRNVRGSAPSGIRYSEPVETPSPSLIYKTHDLSSRPEDRHSQQQQMHSEPTGTASHSEAQADQWAGWERWMRAHLDNERVQTEASLGAVVRDLTDGTLAVADALEDKVLDLQAEVRELKAEVARLTTIVSDLRLAQASTPVDLPRLPLRSAREMN